MFSLQSYYDFIRSDLGLSVMPCINVKGVEDARGKHLHFFEDYQELVMALTRMTCERYSASLVVMPTPGSAEAIFDKLVDTLSHLDMLKAVHRVKQMEFANRAQIAVVTTKGANSVRGRHVDEVFVHLGVLSQ